MVVPKLRFPEFEGEWRKKKFYDCVEIPAKLVDPNKKEFMELPHIGPGNIAKFTGTLLDYKLVKEENLISGKFYFTENEVIYGKINPQLSKVCFPKFKGLCSADAYPISSLPGQIIPSLLFQLLLHKRFLKFSTSVSMRTGMPKINRDELSQYNFVLPNIPEQEKIALFFEKIDKKIQLQQEKIDLLKEQKKGFMQKIFSQELRFKDEDGQEFPKWTTNILTHFALVNPKSEELSPEFRYIDLEAVVDGELLSTQVISKQSAPSRAQRVVRKGDILYQTVRPYQKNNLLYNHDFSEQVVASTGYAQIKAKENTDSAFLYQLMNTEKFTYYVLQRCTGTSYPAINSSDLGEIEIQMPVLKEQQKIAVFLSKVDKKVAIERNKLKTLQHQKQAFMQQMFI